MIIEEDDESTPEVNEASVFVEAMNTHVPVNLLPFVIGEGTRSEDLEKMLEMEVAPVTEGTMPVETEYLSEGADLEIIEEQQAPAEQEEGGNDNDDEDEAEEAEAAPP